MFPLGQYTKSEVRTIARKAGLFTATKKDSQGVCFLGDIDMKDFLKHYITVSPGDVLNESGDTIGTHDGAWFYTIGERHGFSITKKTASDKPFYVVAKDIKRNTITVSNTKKIYFPENIAVVTLRQPNWFVIPKTDTSYTAQIRYHGSLLPARYINENTVSIEIQESIPYGQSVVLYDGDILIGGGVIDSIA